MKPNKQKHQSLKRKIFVIDKQENWLLMSKNPELPRIWQKLFKRQGKRASHVKS